MKLRFTIDDENVRRHIRFQPFRRLFSEQAGNTEIHCQEYLRKVAAKRAAQKDVVEILVGAGARDESGDGAGREILQFEGRETGVRKLGSARTGLLRSSKCRFSAGALHKEA